MKKGTLDKIEEEIKKIHKRGKLICWHPTFLIIQPPVSLVEDIDPFPQRTSCSKKKSKALESEDVELDTDNSELKLELKIESGTKGPSTTCD